MATKPLFVGQRSFCWSSFPARDGPGIAAGAGALIGGLIGGTEGVLPEILIGGGRAFLGTKGEEVRLPPESRLVVELTDNIAVPAPPFGNNRIVNKALRGAAVVPASQDLLTDC